MNSCLSFYHEGLDVIPSCVFQDTSLTDLRLDNNSITDISQLRGNTTLTHLNIGLNYVNDISPLADNHFLTMLHLPGNKLENIDALCGCTNLTYLDLTYNPKLKTLPPDLYKLTRLLSLFIGECQIEDLSPVGGCTSLVTLHAFSNHAIEDISPLTSLQNLQTLNLDENLISNLSPLRECMSLVVLHVSTNRIKSIPEMELIELYADDNKIQDISVFRDNKTLEVLSVSRNLIRDVSPLKDSEIMHLWLSGNTLICDITHLIGNCPLTSCDVKGCSLDNNQRFIIKRMCRLNRKNLNNRYDNLRDICRDHMK